MKKAGPSGPALDRLAATAELLLLGLLVVLLLGLLLGLLRVALLVVGGDGADAGNGEQGGEDHVLPLYDLDALGIETELLLDWYVPHHLNKELSANAALRRTDLVGRTGLEAAYDQYLRGIPGARTVAVDNTGAVTGTVSTTAAVPGDYVVTNIDAKVQAVAEKALATQIAAARSGKTFKCGGGACRADSGSIVVMDVTNGAVVAMASYPDYNPTVWVGGVTQREYRALTSKSSGFPLLTRAWSGQYIPASTFKEIGRAHV